MVKIIIIIMVIIIIIPLVVFHIGSNRWYLLDFETHHVSIALQNSSSENSSRDFRSTSKNYLSYIYYPFTPWDFFTPVLADGLSLEFEWQQVSSNL